MEQSEPTSPKRSKLGEQVDNASDIKKSDRHLLTLPSEVQERILSLLDDEALIRAEITCLKWRRIIASPRIFKHKCMRHLHKHPHLAPTFRRHDFQNNSARPGWCKQFYFGLRRSLTWSHHAPSTLVKDCLEPEVDGNTVDLSWSEEWGRLHNYSGVYDMVYDREAGRLFCSVFDTIQVWDADSLRCLKILTSASLDGPSKDTKTICFHAVGDLLVCGTNTGTIKVIDVWTGKTRGDLRNNGAEIDRKHTFAAIVDVKVYEDKLFSVDCFGDIRIWRLDLSSGKVTYFEDIPINVDSAASDRVRNLYPRRNYERTLDVNSDIIVTNTRELLVVLARRPNKSGQRAVTYALCPNNILCLRAHGCFAYFGIMNGVVCRTELRPSASSRLISNISSECDHVRTAFGDNITSLDVDGDRLAIGDVNGEVHVCSVSGFGSNKDRAPDFSLDSGHAYKSYVWCVKLDGERIFSGDRDGKMVVHDFWRNVPLDEKESGSVIVKSQTNK